MGTTTYWKCDRCGCEQKERPRHPYDDGNVSLVYMVAGSVAAYDHATWKELCLDCSRTVEDAMQDLKKLK
jgi:hypothetical protein